MLPKAKLSSETDSCLAARSPTFPIAETPTIKEFTSTGPWAEVNFPSRKNSYANSAATRSASDIPIFLHMLFRRAYRRQALSASAASRAAIFKLRHYPKMRKPPHLTPWTQEEDGDRDSAPGRAARRGTTQGDGGARGASRWEGLKGVATSPLSQTSASPRTESSRWQKLAEPPSFSRFGASNRLQTAPFHLGIACNFRNSCHPVPHSVPHCAPRSGLESAVARDR